MQNTLVRLRPHNKFATFPEFKKKLKNFKKNLEIKKILLFARVYILYIPTRFREFSESNSESKHLKG